MIEAVLHCNPIPKTQNPNQILNPETGGAVQGYLAHKKQPFCRTLQWAYAWGPMVVLGGGRFLMSEVPLWHTLPDQLKS